MTPDTQDYLLQAWKQQVDSGMHLVETLVEGATRLHEVQIEAAADAHADLEATRKSLAAAADLPQLVKVHSEWAAANARKCAEYWRDVYTVVARTQGELARCACAQSAAVPEEPSNKALLGAIDDAYRQWLDVTQQFYRVPAARPEEPVPAAVTVAAAPAKPRANGGRARGERRPAQ